MIPKYLIFTVYMPTEQQKITDLTEMFLYACKGVFTARFYLSFPQFEKSYFSVLERIPPCLEHSSEIWFSQTEHMNQTSTSLEISIL